MYQDEQSRPIFSELVSTLAFHRNRAMDAPSEAETSQVLQVLPHWPLAGDASRSYEIEACSDLIGPMEKLMNESSVCIPKEGIAIFLKKTEAIPGNRVSLDSYSVGLDDDHFLTHGRYFPTL